MNYDQHFWARVVFVAAVLVGVTVLAAKHAGAQAVGNVGRVGVLMGPVGDGGSAGGMPAGAILTEGGEGLLTESGVNLIIE